jgi:hypothetical protein
MARVFAYFMEKKYKWQTKPFSRYLRNYKKAILKAYALNNSKTNISATAFEIALKQLV